MAAKAGPVLPRDELEVRPLEAGTWDLFAGLVERQGGLFGGCWCVWFHLSAEERRQEDRDNRAIKRRLVEEGVAHAALVDKDVEAGEWAE